MELRHPNITPIYGVGEVNGKSYILMEYFDGFNLHQARDISGAPKPSVVLDFVERIASALGYAHHKGIVHRDIKPSNLLTIKGDARVVDFGIAQILDPSGERFTLTGATPVGDAYAAPELVDNPRLLDSRCDIFSLGACWFWLLTGTTPRGTNWEASLRAVEEMGPSYENVILKTLDEPEKRYQTMEQLLDDIRALKVGTAPEADTNGELDDNACLILGIVFGHCSPERVTTSVYRLEQELSGKLNRFAFALALKKLRKYQLVEDIDTSDFYEDGSGIEIKVTSAGEDWVEANHPRISKLIETTIEHKQTGEKATAFDDIPF